MRLILLRHGEHDKDHLTLEGEKNVKSIAKQLKEFNVAKIYSSSANRCVETAEIVQKLLKISKINVKKQLKERFQLTHLPTTPAEQRWWDNYMNLNYVEPKNDRVGETLNEFITKKLAI